MVEEIWGQERCLGVKGQEMVYIMRKGKAESMDRG
jgi:hypothetical protein